MPPYVTYDRGEVPSDIVGKDMIYPGFEPVATRDFMWDNALLKYCQVIGFPLEFVYYMSRYADGPGWWRLFDPNTCPPIYLDWALRMAGEVPNPSQTEEEKRELLRSLPNLERGRPQKMIEAIQRVLTGLKTVTMLERTTSAYRAKVVTYVGQTPDVNAVLAAIVATKPAGIIVDYELRFGQSYLNVKERNATYQVVKTAHPTYQDLRNVPA